MTDDSRARRRLPTAVWWLLLAWLITTIAAVVWGVPHEEDNLAERAGAALSGQPVAVEFDGRDARLTGSVGDSAEVDRAVATVREVRGVRRVDGTGISVSAPQAPATPSVESAPPDLLLTVDSGAVTVTGTVPDASTAAAIVGATEARWGSDNVTDRLTVGENTSGAAWLAGIVTAIDGVDDLENGSIAVGPGGVLLEGSVPTADTRADIEETFAVALGGTTPIDNRLEVVSLAEPSFEAELLDDGTVRLRGVMPDQPTIDSIVAGAAGVYGSGNVVNEMTVGETVASPAYLESLPGVFGAIDGLSPWRVNVENGAALLSGLAVSEDARTGTVDRLTIALGSGLAIDNQVEVDPNAVATVLTELLKGTATFEIGSAALSTEAMGLLDRAVEILMDNPTTILTVEGHTDDVGSDSANLELSEARARTVVDYLVAGGIDAERLTAIGYGETRPIADNNTADGRSENRRIQFVVEEGGN